MAVEVGDRAPDFELRDQHGTPVRLSGFRGAKNVVLVFYPLAFSGVCTSELCAMRDEFPEVTRDDVELLTVSVDSTFTHRAWSDAEHFQFELLSDFWPPGDLAKRYGVFDFERGIATLGWRSTMLIYAAVEIALILPAASLVFGQPPDAAAGESGRVGRLIRAYPRDTRPVRGWQPLLSQHHRGHYRRQRAALAEGGGVPAG